LRPVRRPGTRRLRAMAAFIRACPMRTRGSCSVRAIWRSRRSTGQGCIRTAKSGCATRARRSSPALCRRTGSGRRLRRSRELRRGLRESGVMLGPVRPTLPDFCRWIAERFRIGDALMGKLIRSRLSINTSYPLAGARQDCPFLRAILTRYYLFPFIRIFFLLFFFSCVSLYNSKTYVHNFPAFLTHLIRPLVDLCGGVSVFSI